MLVAQCCHTYEYTYEYLHAEGPLRCDALILLSDFDVPFLKQNFYTSQIKERQKKSFKSDCSDEKKEPFFFYSCHSQPEKGG